MAKYILSRLLRSIVALFAVMSIIIVMIFTLIPRSKVFDNDPAFTKMKGETKTLYMLQKYDQLGYMIISAKAISAGQYMETIPRKSPLVLSMAQKSRRLLSQSWNQRVMSLRSRKTVTRM